MSQANLTAKSLLLPLLLALVGWGLYASIEVYEESEQSGWSVEALSNPYLAAQRFMAASDIRITDVSNLTRLEELSGFGTLFFSDANQVRSPQQLEQVMAWLKQGGNVIYSADAVEHDDLLLQEFSVEVDWREYGKAEADQDADQSLSETLREYNRQIQDGKSREEISADLQEKEEPLTLIKFGDDIGEIKAAFNDSRILQHPYITDPDESDTRRPFSWSFSEHGVHMMQFEVGSGLLTIVSDPGIWTSYNIDQYDHAYLLWLLSSGEGNFAIIRSVVRDSIYAILLRHASELLIALGVILLMWIWRLTSRFGRLEARDRSASRSLGEHFSSISHYLWHRKQAAYLVAPLRQKVLRKAGQVLAEFSLVDEARQYELIAQRCGRDPSAIARLFRTDDFSEASFVQTVRHLKQLEQSL